MQSARAATGQTSRPPADGDQLSPASGLAPFETRLYRAVFLLAGLYNLAFGLWAGLLPSAFFNLMEMAPPRYPGIWACLGMVVGVYGLLYLHAARRLDQARPIIAVGMLGKVLGPIGAAVAVSQGEMPARILSLLVFNDLLWWLPFGLFLLNGSGPGRSLRAWSPELCAATHLLAVVALLAVFPGGTELQTSPQARADYILRNLTLWRAGWAVWMAAGVSTLGLYAWWGARCGRPVLALAGVLVAGAGLAFDLTGEALLIAWLPAGASTLAMADGGAGLRGFVDLQQTATLLTAVFANGLYVAGGVILTVATPGLRGWLLGLTWCVWIAGAGISATAAAGFLAGVVACTAVLFPLYIAWCVLMGRRLR